MRGTTFTQDAGDVQLDSYSGHFRILGEYWDESRASTLSPDVEIEEKTLREEIMLDLEGSYYHPKFLEFDLQGTFGLEQVDSNVMGSGNDRSLDNENLGWNARLLFFKDHPYSLDTYSYRTETRSRQSFLQTTEAVITETGANMYARRWWIPSRLHYHHFDYRGRGLDNFRESRNNFLLEGSRNEDRYQLNYAAEVNDVGLENFGEDFRDVSARAAYNHFFGEDKEDRWTNSFRIREQTGAITTENATLQSAFYQGLGDDLNAEHSLQFTSSENQGSSTDAYTLRSGLTHSLYDSLTSSGSVQFGRNRVGGGDIKDIGGTARFAYRKQTPWGQLRLGSTTDYYVQDQSNLGGSVPVLDELHVFNIGTPIFLDNPNVDQSTVVVTDLSGLTVYIEGLDYNLALEGNRTRLDVPIGSSILPGSSILVDYTFLTSPDLEFGNLSQDFNFGFMFGAIADLSMSYGFVDQNLISGSDNGILQDTSRLRGGLTVHLGKADLGVDYEDYNADFAPYERTSLTAAYRLQPQPKLSGRVSGTAFETRFDGLVANESGITVDLTFSYQLASTSQLSMRSEYHEVEFQSDSGEGYLVEVNWKHSFKAVDFAFNVRMSDDEYEIATDQRIASVYVSLTRRF